MDHNCNFQAEIIDFAKNQGKTLQMLENMNQKLDSIGERQDAHEERLKNLEIFKNSALVLVSVVSVIGGVVSSLFQSIAGNFLGKGH